MPAPAAQLASGRPFSEAYVLRTAGFRSYAATQRNCPFRAGNGGPVLAQHGVNPAVVFIHGGAWQAGDTVSGCLLALPPPTPCALIAATLPTSVLHAHCCEKLHP